MFSDRNAAAFWTRICNVILCQQEIFGLKPLKLEDAERSW